LLAWAVAVQPAVGPRFDAVQTGLLSVGGSFVNASRRPHR
jgi:hypothetical protein